MRGRIDEDLKKSIDVSFITQCVYDVSIGDKQYKYRYSDHNRILGITKKIYKDDARTGDVI